MLYQAFGGHLTDKQTHAIIGTVSALVILAMAVWARARVVPVPPSSKDSPKPPPLPLLALFLVACSLTPEQAKTAHEVTDATEAACMAEVPPGFGALCLLTDDIVDKIIDAETTHPPTVVVAAKAVKAHRRKYKK
jgi:hypothetical protein